MTQDEIIEMAVSNGFYKNDEGTITSPFIEDIDISELLLGFAEDVAAKEREACAKICEDKQDSYESRGFPREFTAARACAAAIRARGEA